MYGARPKASRRYGAAAFGIVVGLWAGFAQPGYSEQAQQACTLNPSEGGKQAVLSGGITARATWSACTGIVQDFVFEWPREQAVSADSPANSMEALKTAADLLRQWREAMKSATVADGSFNFAAGLSPFADLVEAIERRAAQPERYVLGETFAVSDEPGWDGASVSLSSTTQVTRLAIHYWANP